MIGSFSCYFGFLVQRYIEKHPKYSDSSLLLEIFFSIFYRNRKFPASSTAKSRRVGEKLISQSYSAANNT